MVKHGDELSSTEIVSIIFKALIHFTGTILIPKTIIIVEYFYINYFECIEIFQPLNVTDKSTSNPREHECIV